MHLQLLTPRQVMELLPQWRSEHPRLKFLLEHYGESVSALRQMGLLYWREGDHVAATRMLTGAVALAPDQASLWSYLGSVRLAAGSRSDAKLYLERALAVDASSARDWLLLGTILSEGPDRDRAEEAFLNAIECESTSADAALGLGLLFMRTRRYEQAAHFLRKAILSGASNQSVCACLGQVLYSLGDFTAAAQAFAEALHHSPDDTGIRRKYSQARFIEALLTENPVQAIATYSNAAATEPEDVKGLMRNAFHVLSGYGHIEAAIRVGEWIDGDESLSYLLSALTQEPLTSAPESYIISHFDGFAERFDTQLVEVLDYRCPEKLCSSISALTEGRTRGIYHIVDLGCGTGLAGTLLASFGGRLTGVDLSAGMLEKARQRDIYEELVQCEAVRYLAETSGGAYDLVFAADVLIYVGDLGRLVPEVARVLTQGGLFALTIEEAKAAETFQILPSGRFAHSAAYVEDLCRGAFTMRVHERTMIRLEAGRPVDGMLMVFERL